MNKPLIETYYNAENGFHPFFIREHWQVAQLNYLDGYGFDTISKMEKHRHTDEVFVLTHGNAVLIGAKLENNHATQFEYMVMKRGVTYNVPANTWHNIAMDEDAQITIVEKSNTHLYDCTYHPLSADEQEKVKNEIALLVAQ